MRVLLDSHILLWAMMDDRSRLTAEMHQLISSSDNVVFVSLVSCWELQIKKMLGKIKLPDEFFKKISSVGYELLPIKITHIDALEKLPNIHRDPFDRMLIAQALMEDIYLLTQDEEIQKYDVKII